jgi:dTDP-4-dehydrorhamnose 3,5-epimerase
MNKLNEYSDYFNSSVKLITPKIFKDNRGYFTEGYNYKNYKSKYKITDNFIQDNISFSKNKSTIRGMHLQKEPYAQSKLIIVTQGSIIDFFVDLRKNSKTFGQHKSVILKSKKKQFLFIGKGFAHGFKTLEENTTVLYKVSNYYSSKNELTLDYLDKNININWKIKNENPYISDKDKKGLSLDKIRKYL